MPKISIILPVHNGEQYLSQSVQSIFRQTFEDWELIIVDDASSDNTPKLIADFVQQDSRIRFFRSDVNLKLPNALNQGFSLAKGDYFTWTSDDNLYKENALERMLHFLEANKSIDFVYTDYTVVDHHCAQLKTVVVDNPEKLIPYCVVGPCFLFKKEIFLKLGGYDDYYRYVEDHEFWLRCYLNFKLAPLHENLYLYRIHNSTLSASRKIEVVLKKQEMLLKYMHVAPNITNRAKAKTYMLLLDDLRFLEKPYFCWDFVKKAFKYSPGYVLRNLPRALLARDRKH